MTSGRRVAVHDACQARSATVICLSFQDNRWRRRVAATQPNRLINLYSDTQTKPCAAMRKAMAEADVGDEQRGEDPTTNRLQEMVAEYTGKEAAVFLPSGTMCNQIAMLVHCRPGDEIIGSAETHVFTSEGAGAAVLAGAQTLWIPSDKGIFSGKEVAEAVRTGDGRHNPTSRVVVIEQTCNRGGGAIWKTAQIEDVAKTAKGHGLIVHMDGARLPNAVVGSGVKATEMCRHVDTVWLDLSKGLGCPIGGVLAGSKAFIHEAWRWKHRLGGAMRQSGIVAAAGVWALEHNMEKLAEDHANARRLGEHITAVKGFSLYTPKIETNIVYFDPAGAGFTSTQVYEALLKKGVRMGLTYGNMIRAVTHLDVSREDIDVVGKALGEVAKELRA
ncbi:MAG: aminotransferase class I/II-fold pyridoxal phosphate-dependent enzyme [Proteobacteria bacterium]|nr:aminotransferase class I/II-fold pyridoxal phosphate-dependent enzyme [Pseudomonadota bacterium]